MAKDHQSQPPPPPPQPPPQLPQSSPSPDQTSSSDDESTMMDEFTTRSRCCFFLPCFGSGPTSFRSGLSSSSSSPSVWERLQQTAETEDRWWAGPLKGLKKVREWSEIIAGPKWKTFIRRFNRNGSGGKSGSGNGNLKFRYDPLSYSLNFDEGQNGHFADEFRGGFPDFSSRFVSVPHSCKSSMDLGRNGVSFSSSA